MLPIVEVADTSLPHDRHVKVALYANAGNLEGWLADLNGEHVIVYREPTPKSYRDVREARGAEPRYRARGRDGGARHPARAP